MIIYKRTESSIFKRNKSLKSCKKLWKFINKFAVQVCDRQTAKPYLEIYQLTVGVAGCYLLKNCIKQANPNMN